MINLVRWPIILFVLIGYLVLLPVVVAAEQSDSTASVPTFTFKEAIPMPGADILNLNANGTHLLVLHNVFEAPDQVRTYTVEGVEVSRLSTDTSFTSGVAWDGSSFLVGRSFIDGASEYDLYRMDTNGNFSPPLFSFSSPTQRVPFGLGFDGVNVWASTGVFSGASGGFDYVLEVIDGTTNDLVGTRIINLDALGIPYGVAWHNNEFFLGLELAQKVFRFDANLNLLETIDVPGPVRGLGFVGDEMFVADRGAAVVYHFVPSNRDGEETRAEKAVGLAKSVVGAPYLGDGETWDGKGWNGTKYVEPDEIRQGYDFWNNAKREMDFGAGLDCSGLIQWSFNRAFDPTKPPKKML